MPTFHIASSLRISTPARRLRTRHSRPLLPLQPLETRTLLSTLVVNTTLDVVDPSDSRTSLREAVIAAAPNDTLTFAKALTQSGPATITLTGGELAVSANLTITGPGANLLTIDGNNASRLFRINDGTVKISSLTLQNGTADNGGAILNRGSLTLNHCLLRANTATTFGGAIYNQGTLLVTQSEFAANTAFTGGAIDSEGPTTLKYDNFHNNSASFGGAVATFTADATIPNSTFATNTASNRGGAIYNHESNMTLVTDTLSQNTVNNEGGGVYNDGVMTVKVSSITGNTATNAGGGFMNRNALTIQNSTLSGNTATDGGAIANGPSPAIDPRLTLTTTTLRDNSASNRGGAIFNAEFGAVTINGGQTRANIAGNQGGGIFNAGNLALNRTTVLNNTAPVGADLFNAPGSLLIVNHSTIGQQSP